MSPIVPIDVQSADGDFIQSADGAQLVVRGDPSVLPALSGVARCNASRCGASGREAFINIDGTDRTNDIDWRTIRWKESTGGDADQLKFNLKHDIGEDAPRPDAVVTLAVGTRENIEFTGNIGTFLVSNKHPTAIENSRRYVITADGNERSINARKVNGVFTGSASDVVIALIAASAPSFTSNGVDSGAPVVGEMSFKFETFTKAMDRLAERVGWFWQLRGNDVLFYQESSIIPSAAPLLEGLWGWYREPALAINLDITQQRNRIFVEGSGSQLQAVVDPGETIVPVTDGLNFQALVELQTNGGYLNGTTLLETTQMTAWGNVGAPTVVSTTPPLNEGSNAPAVRIDGDNTQYIHEKLNGHEDGEGIFSILVQDPLVAGSGTGRVVVQDTIAAATLLDVTVDITDPANPTATATVGTIHRDPVRFTLAGATGVWFWFVFRTGVDMIAVNATEMRLFGSDSASAGALDFWGPMGQNTVAPEYQYSWFVPVDFFFLPATGETVPLRSREIAYVENEFIAYRFMFSGELQIENFATWSHRLENWIEDPDNSTVVLVDVDVDEEGNLTLDRVAWDGTGGAGNPQTVGVNSISSVVPDDESTPGLFSMVADATNLGVDNTGFVQIGFFDPSTGATLQTATQKIFASFDLSDGSVVLTGTGSGNSGETVFTDSSVYATGKYQVAVAGTITGGWAFGDEIACGIYPCASDGTTPITPTVDGEYVNVGRAGLIRGLGSIIDDYPILETAGDPIVIGAEVDAIFGVPGAGRILSIQRRHGDGAEINPILVDEDQAAQFLRSDILAEGSDPPNWVNDGPVEFYKRDRRLSADGMLSAAQLELAKWLGGTGTDNAIPTAKYTTRDQLARAGAPVNIDVPTGWGITFSATITSVTTRWLKQGLQEKAVSVSLITPRNLYDLLRDTKRFDIEET